MKQPTFGVGLEGMHYLSGHWRKESQVPVHYPQQMCVRYVMLHEGEGPDEVSDEPSFCC